MNLVGVLGICLLLILILSCCLCNKELFSSPKSVYFDKSDNLPDSDLYVLYSAGNSGYQEWQSDLLDFSFKESKQPGILIRIVSDDSKDQRPIIKTKDPKERYTMITPDFSKLTDTKIWPVMNKPGSMEYFINRLSPEFKQRNKQATLVFLDPDMIFIKSWDPRNDFKMGEVIGQKWKGYSNGYCSQTSIDTGYCPKSESNSDNSGPLMFPFAIKMGDMEKIAGDVSNYAKKGYLKHNQWMADMSAFVTAIEKHELKNKQIDNLGICNDWDNNDDPDAKIMHYCQAAKNKDGKEIWGKRRYQSGYKHGDTFDPVPDPSETMNRVDREVLTLINRFRVKQSKNK